MDSVFLPRMFWIAAFTAGIFQFPTPAVGIDYTFTKIVSDQDTGFQIVQNLPAINGRGDVVFRATLESGDQAILVMTRDGEMLNVADTTVIFPLLTSPIRTFGFPDINDDRLVAFTALYLAPPIMPQRRRIADRGAIPCTPRSLWRTNCSCRRYREASGSRDRWSWPSS